MVAPVCFSDPVIVDIVGFLTMFLIQPRNLLLSFVLPIKVETMEFEPSIRYKLKENEYHRIYNIPSTSQIALPNELYVLESISL